MHYNNVVFLKYKIYFIRYWIWGGYERVLTGAKSGCLISCAAYDGNTHWPWKCRWKLTCVSSWSAALCRIRSIPRLIRQSAGSAATRHLCLTGSAAIQLRAAVLSLVSPGAFWNDFGRCSVEQRDHSVGLYDGRKYDRIFHCWLRVSQRIKFFPDVDRLWTHVMRHFRNLSRLLPIFAHRKQWKLTYFRRYNDTSQHFSEANW